MKLQIHSPYKEKFEIIILNVMIYNILVPITSCQVSDHSTYPKFFTEMSFNHDIKINHILFKILYI